jgi:hypothetical protein
MRMAVKLVGMYSLPTDTEAFEEVYREGHVPMAMAKRQVKPRW